MFISQIILASAASYLAIGLIYGLFFVRAGVQKVDPMAVDAPLGFRLMILPGVMLLWPAVVVISRHRKGGHE